MNHRNNNKVLYKMIKTIGARPHSRIAQLAVTKKDGNTVTNQQKKANTISQRYQVPLGHHPKKSSKRKTELKKKRKQTYKKKTVPLTKATGPSLKLMQELHGKVCLTTKHQDFCKSARKN